MKKLELNQMENLTAGANIQLKDATAHDATEGSGGGFSSAECRMQMGLYGMANGMLFGPWGFVAGAAAGYFLGDRC